MTPEAVIDRYLETAARDPLDPAEFAVMLGTDADLLSRWLQLLDCPAEPAALVAAIGRLPVERLFDLAMSQALAVLAGSGSARISFAQWRSVLDSSLLAEALANELNLNDPVAVRWRVLLGVSGVNLPQDPLLMELLAFRGARPELLEDASPIHRLFAVVESLDASAPVASLNAAHLLLGVEPERYRALLGAARARGDELLAAMSLSGDADVDPSERLWLRLQLGMLGRLFPPVDELEAFLDVHAQVSRRLFGRVPVLFLLDASGERLRNADGTLPEIALRSAHSTIARSMRLGERSELIERPDQSVADRQVLRQVGSTEGVCLPLADGQGSSLGALVFATDEDADQETAMALYAAELARRLGPAPNAPGADPERMARYRQREEKRLRELVHEANNPLSIVNNYLHILELKLAHEPGAVEQLRLIGSEVRRASDIIGQARDLPELEAERPDAGVEFEVFDLNDLARRQVELHIGYAADQQVALQESLVPGQQFIRSDQQRLAQILTNLLRNAIEAGRGAVVTVGTASGVFREGREGVLLIVSDTGPGLPREVLERLSEPKQTRKQGDHSGLGLHIVHRLVAELGASMDVRTGPSQGTSFSIFLPLTPSPP